MQTTCLDCGMAISYDMSQCPKCDNPLKSQHDGSTVTVDIAHNGERLHEALQKMREEIALARKGVAQNIRLVVGSGRIRDEVLLALGDLMFRGVVKDFDQEENNKGAVLIRLK